MNTNTNTNTVRFTRVNYQDPSYTGKKLVEYRAKAKDEGVTTNQINAFKMLCYNYKITITVPQNKAEASDKLTYLYGLAKLNKLERRTDKPSNAKVVILDNKFVLVVPKVQDIAKEVAPCKEEEHEDYISLKGAKVPKFLKKYFK